MQVGEIQRGVALLLVGKSLIESGFVGAGVDGEKGIALVNVGAVGEMNFGDGAGDLREHPWRWPG